MGKYVYIEGLIQLFTKYSDEPIIDDGTLSKTISEILTRELAIYGVGEVDIDFDVSAKFHEVKKNG